MSNPVFDLQGIVAAKVLWIGMVLSIDHGVAQVATKNGSC